MQLFILDRDPEISARMLADIHLRKMSLETAQILSAVIVNQRRSLPENLPKAYNPAHPVIKALDSKFKINWTVELNCALHREYFCRFRKFHAYAPLSEIYRQLLHVDTPGDAEWSFARAFKDFSTSAEDIVQAYREYYRFKKSIIRQWSYTNAAEPEWLKTAPGFFTKNSSESCR